MTVICVNCGQPLDAHCTVHVVPCCPGRCKGSAEEAAGEAGASAGEPAVSANGAEALKNSSAASAHDDAWIDSLRREQEQPATVGGIPTFLRQAMEKAGVDPDEVAAKIQADGEQLIPTDADEALRQAAAADGIGMRCKACRGPVRLDDPNMLVEVIGWSKHRAQGGQNHVIDRAETGLMMCGDCALRLQHLGSAGFAQETLV